MNQAISEIESELTDEAFLEITKTLTNITVVRDAATAQSVLEKLYSLPPDTIYACDTEVSQIDVKKQSPIGNGYVTCVSIYCGPDVDFGSGSILWIDNLGKAEGNLEHFKSFFEDESRLKVWHNYGFDRHVMYNHRINVKGFGGDTMHMARLWDTSRLTKGGYSLEALSEELLGIDSKKIPYTELFGRAVLKSDGTEGKKKIVPPVDKIQSSVSLLKKWIEYSAKDAEVTWNLMCALKAKLQAIPNKILGYSMWEFYLEYWRPFGEVLTDMEREGIRLDVSHLDNILSQAQADQHKLEESFCQWLYKVGGPDAQNINYQSDAQLRHLLFAPYRNKKTKEAVPKDKEFEMLNEDGFIEEGKKKPKKHKPFIISGLGMTPISYTTAGWPQVNQVVMKALAGSPHAQIPSLGQAAHTKIQNTNPLETCRALDALNESNTIDTLLRTFIVPLREFGKNPDQRVHASLNINTETGRLSCRKPNLQNQPALEKDRYSIRKAFICDPGNKIISADYGQLELRLLAHMTRCQSMIEAFKLGGDFHSRTAKGMYNYIQQDVDSGAVLIEWNYKKGPAPVPLLKDKYATERRHAKTLNFSIAYGKTAHGLAKDWKVSLEEANNILNLWYQDRPEVREWQQKTIAYARKKKMTFTLMGRHRNLSGLELMRTAQHAERSSINTPIQGGAADVVMCAMIKVHNDLRLREMGWRLLLQVHDELILEGPAEHADEALSIVVGHMKRPFFPPMPETLEVELVVDARIADNWLEAK